eukprot:6473365-Amphidinium_carterae.1
MRGEIKGSCEDMGRYDEPRRARPQLLGTKDSECADRASIQASSLRVERLDQESWETSRDSRSSGCRDRGLHEQRVSVGEAWIPIRSPLGLSGLYAADAQPRSATADE